MFLWPKSSGFVSLCMMCTSWASNPLAFNSFLIGRLGLYFSYETVYVYMCLCSHEFFIPLWSPWHFARVPWFLMCSSPCGGVGDIQFWLADYSSKACTNPVSPCMPLAHLFLQWNHKAPPLSSFVSGSKHTKITLHVQDVSHPLA